MDFHMRAALPSRWAPPWGYAIATAFQVAMAALLVMLRAHANLATVCLVFILAIMATAIALGSGPALLSAVLGTLILNYFFIPPIYTWSIRDPQNCVAFTAFVICAIRAVCPTSVLALCLHPANLSVPHFSFVRSGVSQLFAPRSISASGISERSVCPSVPQPETAYQGESIVTPHLKERDVGHLLVPGWNPDHPQVHDYCFPVAASNRRSMSPTSGLAMKFFHTNPVR
jgi:hypothetical protein